MTGFASGEGRSDIAVWSWDLRAVNARGLDLRLRVPDWIDGLEATLRKRLSDALGRGAVTLNLRATREGQSQGPQLNTEAVENALSALETIEKQAMARGLSLAPATTADILAMRGVLDGGETRLSDEDIATLRAAVLADFENILLAFITSRAAEGAALEALLAQHLDDIEALTTQADHAVAARSDAIDVSFRTALNRVTNASDDINEDRIAQELAILAVKADVTEELGRLRTHIDAGRTLLANGGPVGRRFDFLMQEFNREANTLCSKSGDSALTAIGLDLKTKIDQLREQVQNVE